MLPWGQRRTKMGEGMVGIEPTTFGIACVLVELAPFSKEGSRGQERRLASSDQCSAM